MTVYGERRKRLLSLAKGKQVASVTPANVFYLTGFWGGGAAIALPDKSLVITSPLEADRARELGREAEVVVVKKWKDVEEELVRRTKGKPTIVDDDSGIRGAKGFTRSPEAFLEARRVKDETEIGRINQASRKLDRIFEALPGELRPGRTEWEVAAQVMKLATEQGLTPSGSDSALSPTIIASGENGALPHSELTDRKIRRGDFVVADIFFRYGGYNSDETRTFAVGSASATMRKHYATVLEAQEVALKVAKAGNVCEDVHLAAVEVLRKQGVEKYLNHSVGHGVGIDIHELPAISRGSKSKLLRNDVITDEPGIYLLGKYGIRIEDTLRVDSRPEVLTKYTKDLVVA